MQKDMQSELSSKECSVFSSRVGCAHQRTLDAADKTNVIRSGANYTMERACYFQDVTCRVDCAHQKTVFGVQPVATGRVPSGTLCSYTGSAETSGYTPFSSCVSFPTNGGLKTQTIRSRVRARSRCFSFPESA